MSSPLHVKISREGKEIGTYDLAEVVRLLRAGTLKPTDIYWHEGMVGWELLSKLDASEGLRLPAEPEVKRQSNNIFFGCGGCGLFTFLLFAFFSVSLYEGRPRVLNAGDPSVFLSQCCGAISRLGLGIVIINVCIVIFRKKWGKA